MNRSKEASITNTAAVWSGVDGLDCASSLYYMYRLDDIPPAFRTVFRAIFREFKFALLSVFVTKNFLNSGCGTEKNVPSRTFSQPHIMARRWSHVVVEKKPGILPELPLIINYPCLLVLPGTGSLSLQATLVCKKHIIIAFVSVHSCWRW